MAQKYGGKFSPEGTPDNARKTPTSPFAGAKRTQAGGRVNLLFIVPFVLVWRAFRSGPETMALYLVGFGLLLLAAWLTREGIKAHEAYDARRIAKRPAIPRKIFGSVITGAALFFTGVASYGILSGLFVAILFGVLGTALHFFAFGPDPLSDKGAEGIDEFQSDRVARVVDEGESLLRGMEDAALRAEEREISRRVSKFQDTVRAMFRTVEDDPRDLTAARKYMTVYLRGARDATVKFADYYARTNELQAKYDYLHLLDDLEDNFEKQTEKLLGDNRTDLDIEIEVLRDRLARDGVKFEDTD